MFSKTLKNSIVFLIRSYQRWISAALPPSCRFYPTCSQYMAEALEHHPLHRALGLGLRRICRCHPWGGSGWDPVPTTPTQAKKHV